MRALRGRAEDNRLEGISVLGAHEVVEDRVEGGGEEVEAAREVEEILIDGSVDGQVLEVDIAKALEVEGGPGDKEENNNRNYQEEEYQC